ncbi:MAG: AMP-binding protein, partial [Burkholderiaceae bacterium]
MNNDVIRRQTLADILRRSALRYPNRLAVSCGEINWTYREFDDLTNRLAAGLSGLGITMGDKVAVLARNSHGFAAMRFALARLGAVLVPINFMLNASEVAYILRHAGAKFLATDTELTALAKEAAALDTEVAEFIWLPSEAPATAVSDMHNFHTLCDCTNLLAPNNLQSTDLAQIVYTSGTESLPKGAMLTHDAVLWEYVTCLIDASIEHQDIALHALPLYHCAQLDVFFGPAIYVGGINVIT